MKERPILFSKPMIQAILAGRKTQTRRVAKLPICITLTDWVSSDIPEVLGPRSAPPGRYEARFNPHGAVSVIAPDGIEFGVKPAEFDWVCPYGDVGDRLWVRETWCMLDRDHWADPEKPQNWLYSRASPRRNAVAYWAETDADGDRCRIEYGYKWRPSIHMPRWASRLTLEITSVRLQRLQEISEEDAVAEGVGPGFVPCPHPKFSDMQSSRCVGYRPMFARLWDEINAKRGHAWPANPMVWAITFKRI